MTCETCGEKPKKCGNCNKDFPRAVIEINNPESLILLRKVSIPASMGTEEDVPAAIGKYRNVILKYEANGHIYFYSSDGIPTLLEVKIPDEIWERIEDLEEGLADLEQEVEDLKNAPDVVDIVDTYADLQAYDTSSLGDKDVIRVLSDETHNGDSSYYRWSTSTQTWTFIGSIHIDERAFKPFPDSVVTDGTTQQFLNSIMALSPETGMAYLGTVTLSDMPASLIQEEVEVYIYSDYVAYAIMRSTDTAPYAWWCSSYNYGGWRAVDTTYTVFTGTDSINAGTSGLVPAPAAADAGKVLGANGTWVADGPSIDQSVGDSTTSVMSQKATTAMVFARPGVTNTDITIGNNISKSGAFSNSNCVVIGDNAYDGSSSQSAGSNQVYIGHYAGNGSKTNRQIDAGRNNIAIGNYATAFHTSNNFSEHGQISIGESAFTTDSFSIAIGSNSLAESGGIAIGPYANSTTMGEVNIGTTQTSTGYSSSNYRLLTGLYDPVNAHDAATKGYVDTNSLASTTTFWGQTISNGAVKGDIVFEGDLLTNGKGISPVNNGIEMIGGTAGIYLHGTNGYDDVADFNMATIAGVKDGSSDTDAINLRQLNKTLLVNGTTAPTSSTVGKVGSLCSYIANGVKHIAVCTAVTPGDPPTYTWADFDTGLVTLSYGYSTWNDFLTAYNAGKIVYCRASSNADPSSGSQTRMAFMAYINNPTTPTEVEFQYVRSVSSKTAAQQMDQVFVYKLTSASGGTWTVTTRDMASKIVAGTNMTSSYNSGTLTLNATADVTSTTLNTRLDDLTLLRISQTDYDNLGTKDPDTLYIITGS